MRPEKRIGRKRTEAMGLIVQAATMQLSVIGYESCKMIGIAKKQGR